MEDISSKLVVLFDTSSIRVDGCEYLIRKHVSDMIKANSSDPSFSVHWGVPNIVLLEREYQMRIAAQGMRSVIKRLKRLFGDELSLTPEEVDIRIHERVDEQVKELGIVVEKLDFEKVEWGRIVDDAVWRRPPFSGGEKEKGFRDAVILETFLQAASREQRSAMRIALVIEDRRLSKSAQERTQEFRNVRVVTVGELAEILKALSIQIDDKVISSLLPLAKRLFYSPNDTSSLFIRESVERRIREEGHEMLQIIPEGADERRNQHQQWSLDPPQFIGKDGPRFIWLSRITIPAVGIKREFSDAALVAAAREQNLQSNEPMASTGLTITVGSEEVPKNDIWQNYGYSLSDYYPKTNIGLGASWNSAIAHAMGPVRVGNMPVSNVTFPLSNIRTWETYPTVFLTVTEPSRILSPPVSFERIVVQGVTVLIPNLLPPKSARATRVPSALAARFL